MASYCDKQAERFGEVGVGVEVEGKGNEVGKELADRVAIEGADCCVPKKKEG
jgi:4a-hydroxytetrahydrobiopterin dehydratase